MHPKQAIEILNHEWQDVVAKAEQFESSLRYMTKAKDLDGAAIEGSHLRSVMNLPIEVFLLYRSFVEQWMQSVRQELQQGPSVYNKLEELHLRAKAILKSMQALNNHLNTTATGNDTQDNSPSESRSYTPVNGSEPQPSRPISVDPQGAYSKAPAHAHRTPSVEDDIPEETEDDSEAIPSPHFYVDTQPTPVDYSRIHGLTGLKRKKPIERPVPLVNSQNGELEQQPSMEAPEPLQSSAKKRKITGTSPPAPPIPVIEYEDISAEVDARLRAQEQRRMGDKKGWTSAMKKEAKRKRQSLDSAASVANGVETLIVTERPRKKKKKIKAEGEDKGGDGPLRHDSHHEANQAQKERRKGKRRVSGEPNAVEVEAERKVKRRKEVG